MTGSFSTVGWIAEAIISAPSHHSRDSSECFRWPAYLITAEENVQMYGLVQELAWE